MRYANGMAAWTEMASVSSSPPGDCGGAQSCSAIVTARDASGATIAVRSTDFDRPQTVGSPFFIGDALAFSIGSEVHVLVDGKPQRVGVIPGEILEATPARIVTLANGDQLNVIDF